MKVEGIDYTKEAVAEVFEGMRRLVNRAPEVPKND